MLPHRLPVAGLLGALLVACPAEETPDPAPVPQAWDAPNPLVPDRPLLPWPSEQYAPPADTPTGVAVRIAPDLVPGGLPTSLFDGADGFSRVTPIVAHLPGGFDAATLPDRHDGDATLSLDSSVWLVDVDEPALWPAFVELDATVASPDQQALLVRPRRPLPWGHRIGVVLTDRLTAADGSPHGATEAFAALRDGTPTEDDAVEVHRAGLEALDAALSTLGGSLDDAVLAWTFRVRSREDVVGRAFALQRHAAAATILPEDFVVDAVETEEDRTLVRAHLTVPRYLDDTNRIVLDEAGDAVVQGTMVAPILVTVPSTVVDPRPAIVFGHGFFSSIEEPTWSNLFDSLELWQMSAITTEFFGFSEGTFLESAAILAGRFEDLDTVMDRQLQSQANFTFVQRAFEAFAWEAVRLPLEDFNFTPIDPEALPYLGISNGGTQGFVLASTSRVIDRAALVVPGGGWAHMLQRASQWSTLGAALADRFGDPRDLQVGMALLQGVFDRVDSLNYVDRLLVDRPEQAGPAPEVLVVEARNDAQVANLVTRWAVDAADIPLLAPAYEPVWGVEETGPDADGMLDPRAAYAMYDLGVPDLPEGNVPPEENGVHDEVRRLPSYKTQMGVFLEEGRFVHPCDGACDPE